MKYQRDSVEFVELCLREEEWRTLLAIFFSWDGHVPLSYKELFGRPEDIDLAFIREALEEASGTRHDGEAP